MKLSTVLVAVLLLACKTAGARVAVAADACSSADVASKASQAQSLAAQKKYAEAEAPANAALAACPSQAVAAAALGQSLVAQNKHDAAISRMSGVIGARNDVAYAYLWRGYAYYHKKQPDKMLGDFETFLRLAPNAPEAASVKQLLASLK